MDTVEDFTVVTAKSCFTCSEDKLKAKILAAFKLSKSEFIAIKNIKGKGWEVKGFDIICECNDFTPIKFKEK